MTDPRIRAAEPRDVPDLIRLVRLLAEYEREPDQATATEQQFHDALFPEQGDPRVFAFVAVEGDAVVGTALWFTTFSTWTGTHGLWLEDLYVEEHVRGTGLGFALIARLAAECVDRGWSRFEWTVLDWNTPSIDFYRSLGAVAMDEWTTRRLTGPALEAVAAHAR